MKELFHELNITAVLAGQVFGFFIVSREHVKYLVQQKIQTWIHAVENLKQAAVRYRQSAYTAFIHSVSDIHSQLLHP